MRKPIIAGNWKMHKTHLDAIHFVEGLRNKLHPAVFDQVDVVVCPPFTALRSVQTVIDADRLPFGLAAQNMHWAPEGAFTGEISPQMLSKLNVGYVIIGHSERREYFGETDEMVNKKVIAATQAGLTPIMCVGETLGERESGATEEKVRRQIQQGVKSLPPDKLATMVIAYEPIWAIGTGRTASAEDAQQTIALIRETISGISAEAGAAVRIQYGGSVKAGNAAQLMACPDIDGALVGGASLDIEEFARIVSYGQ